MSEDFEKYIRVLQITKFQEELAKSKYFSGPKVLDCHAELSLQMCCVQYAKMLPYESVYRFMKYLGLKSEAEYEYMRDMIDVVDSMRKIVKTQKNALTLEGIRLLKIFDTTFTIAIAGIPEAAMYEVKACSDCIEAKALVDEILKDPDLGTDEKDGMNILVEFATNNTMLYAYRYLWKYYKHCKEEKRKRSLLLKQQICV